MSKERSRSSSLGSGVSIYTNASSEDDSSYHTSDFSGSTLSGHIDNIVFILESFIPEEFIPYEDIEEAVSNSLDSKRSSVSISVGSRSSSLGSQDVETLVQVSDSLVALDLGMDKKDAPSLSSINSESLLEQDLKLFKSVVKKLSLGRFLYGIPDESIKEQYEILGRDIDSRPNEQMSLRPGRTGMNKAQLKKHQKDESALTTEGRIVRVKLPKKTVAEVKKEEAKERSDLKAIRTYEKNCMGGFNFVASESGELIVSADSTIDRPTNITGNLGQVAGDHVVPLAMLTKRLQRIVRGKEVYEAIKAVQEFAAGITEVAISIDGEGYRDQNSFQSIIERAREYEGRTEREPRPTGHISINDFNAANFLKSELIPSTVRTWNMQTRAAFLSKKTKQELGKEGNKVRNVLKDLLASENESSSSALDTASSFISVIDYSPVGEDDDRSNDVQQLALVIGSIIDANHLINEQDSTSEESLDLEHQTISSAEDIFNRMLKDHGWIQHYKNNPQDLDPALGLEDGSSLGDEYIKKVIMNTMLEQYPHLKEELDYKTQVKKEELEKDNYIVQDVPRDGNCFFHAIARQTGASQESLRANAIVEINAHPDRYRSFVPGGDLTSYVSRMEKDKEWVDNIMIQAVANSLEQNIQIYNRNGSINTTINVDASITARLDIHRVLYTGNHYMSIEKRESGVGGVEVQSDKGKGITTATKDAHLVRSEKGILSEVKENRQFMNLLAKDLTAEETIMLQDIKRGSTELVPISNRSDSNSISNPFVNLIPEHNHQIDHKQNAINLSQMLDDGLITSSTVICLERKETGNNFGMKDVKLLAAILRYNDNNKQPLPIAKDIKSSTIYHDAMLYNKAQSQGVEVVGVEGKNLKYNKGSPNYNQEREEQMADRINQLTASGKNVILLVGSSHVFGIRKQLKGRVISLDKGKEINIVANMRNSLQEGSISSYTQVIPVSQGKKRANKLNSFI